MFIASLFTIAQTWEQPKCPSVDDWINEVIHTHTHTHTIEILPFKASCMDLEHIMLIEISQKKEDKYYKISLVCGI